MKLYRAITAAMAASAFIYSPASAVVMTKTYDFTASGFNTTSGSGTVPVPVVTGSFTLTFDNAITTLNGTGVTVNNLNLQYSGPVNFVYYSVDDSLSITNGDYLTSTANTNDFSLSLRNATVGQPDGRSFNYSQAGYNNVATTRNVVITNGATTAVPEPATWAMLTIGFGLVGGAVRRRQRANLQLGWR